MEDATQFKLEVDKSIQFVSEVFGSRCSVVKWIQCAAYVKAAIDVLI